MIANISRGVPMKRVAEVDEVVEAILFAADPKNSFMTGHALAVDGGIGGDLSFRTTHRTRPQSRSKCRPAATEDSVVHSAWRGRPRRRRQT